MKKILRQLILACSAVFAGVLVVSGAADPAGATARAVEARQEAQAKAQAEAQAQQQEQAQVRAEAAAAKGRCCHVTVPKRYRYNPDTNHERTLHDYCSYSPDEYRVPGKNARFQGPCARHDLCYDHHEHSQKNCDRRLFKNLARECTYTYAWYDPRRGGCLNTAAVYYSAVAAHTWWG